jgi:membrane-bound metal-dependent hydrolase YbcI (DUF457 family)
MPFTPFHMGPGVLFKGLLQGSFSLMIFGWTQVVMDIQPLLVMLTGEGHLHGFSHTWIGATLLALFAALTGRYLSPIGLWMLRISPGLHTRIPWWIVVVSAFIGGYSHVLLDSIMHADVQPYYPFILSNHYLGLISVDALHQFCLYTGLLGGAIYYFVQWRGKKI